MKQIPPCPLAARPVFASRTPAADDGNMKGVD